MIASHDQIMIHVPRYLCLCVFFYNKRTNQTRAVLNSYDFWQASSSATTWL